MHSSMMIFASLWLTVVSQAYPPRTTEELFSTLRNAARLGQFPSDAQLLDLGFKRSVDDAGVEINSESGRLYLLISGNNRNSFIMTWSPKDPSQAMHESVLSSLISKSSHIELIGKERMKIVINEPNDGPAAFRESLIVGLLDGKLYSTIIEAFSR